jgi:hypothetical protein
MPSLVSCCYLQSRSVPDLCPPVYVRQNAIPELSDFGYYCDRYLAGPYTRRCLADFVRC